MASKQLTEKQRSVVNDCVQCETSDGLFMYKVYSDSSSAVRYQVGCSTCLARGPAMGYTKTAIEKWNWLNG